MTEWYQQTGLVLQPEQEAEVDDGLGAWLVEHRKALKLEVKQEVTLYNPIRLVSDDGGYTARVEVITTDEQPKKKVRK